MLTVRIITITLLICALFGCRKTEQSNQLLKEAMDLYVYANDSAANIDSSIILTNQALDLDSKNIAGLNYMLTLMFTKRNEAELLDTSAELVRLMPNTPYYLGQLAFYNELAGNIEVAERLYAETIVKYKKNLKKYPNDFDLTLEYVTVLNSSGDTTLASQTLEQLEELQWNESQEKILEYYQNDANSKQILVDFWNEKISYEELENILEAQW